MPAFRKRPCADASASSGSAPRRRRGAEAHASELEESKPIRDILHFTDIALLPTMTVKEAVAAFDKAEAEALAVISRPRVGASSGCSPRRTHCAAMRNSSSCDAAN